MAPFESFEVDTTLISKTPSYSFMDNSACNHMAVNCQCAEYGCKTEGSGLLKKLCMMNIKVDACLLEPQNSSVLRSPLVVLKIWWRSVTICESYLGFDSKRIE